MVSKAILAQERRDSNNSNSNNNNNQPYNDSPDDSNLDVSASNEIPFDLPPAYSNVIQGDNASSSAFQLQVPDPIQSLSRLVNLDFPKYSPKHSTLSDDQTIVTCTAPNLLKDPFPLVPFIHEQCALPPKPMMRFKGTHIDMHSQTQVDFDIQLNLTTLLDLPSSVETPQSPSSTRRIQVVSISTTPSEDGSLPTTSSSPSTTSNANLGDLHTWARRFCTEKSDNKSFTISRSTPSLTPGSPALQLLEGLLRNLIASTMYRGTLTISFPSQFSQLTLRTPPGNWLVNMLRLYPEKRFEVVESQWKLYGGVEPGSGEEAAVIQNWWRGWERAVRNAILSGRKGLITFEDAIDAKMGCRERERRRDWARDRDYEWK